MSSKLYEFDAGYKIGEDARIARYRYGGTTVSVTCFADPTNTDLFEEVDGFTPIDAQEEEDAHELVVVTSDAFDALPRIEQGDRDDVAAERVTEFIRQELRLYFEPVEYIIVPGAGSFEEFNVETEGTPWDPDDFLCVVAVDPTRGVLVRDVSGELLAVMYPPEE
jgi:hypothetical protein